MWLAATAPGCSQRFPWRARYLVAARSKQWHPAKSMRGKCTSVACEWRRPLTLLRLDSLTFNIWVKLMPSDEPNYQLVSHLKQFFCHVRCCKVTPPCQYSAPRSQQQIRSKRRSWPNLCCVATKSCQAIKHDNTLSSRMPKKYLGRLRIMARAMVWMCIMRFSTRLIIAIKSNKFKHAIINLSSPQAEFSTAICNQVTQSMLWPYGP